MRPDAAPASRNLRENQSIEGILREYPNLTKRDVQAALKHERKLAASA
jgi:uncharacterized protein (DUF433 family)